MGEFYIEYEYWFAAVQLVLAMLGMGATQTVEDFRDVMREPRSVTIGTLIQLLLVPLIAFVFIQVAGLSGGVAVGVALIAAIPGGTTSNIFTFMARGNAPLSISITGITTLACVLTTPLILSLLITQYLPADFSMPTGQIITEIALTLLLPLTIGMLILRFLPTYAGGISKWSIRASLLTIVFIVVGSSSAGRLDVDAFGHNNMLLVVLLIVLLAVITWGASHLLRLSRADATAIQMEVVVRNVNLGVLLIASMFPVIKGEDNQLGGMALFTVLLYGAVQMLLAILVIALRRRQTAVAVEALD